MAPAPRIPVPATLVTGSAMTSPVPSSSTAAPLAMVVPPAVVPRAPLDWTRITPVVTVVPPLYVLVPERVRVPVPVLARATVPEPLASVPANTVEALPARPPDRVTAPAALLVIVLPATPAIEPSVSEKPARSNVAPLLTLRAELAPDPVGDAQPERARGDRGRPGVRVGDREQQRPRPRLRQAAGTGDGAGRLGRVARAVDREGEAPGGDGPGQGQRAGVGRDLARGAQGDGTRPGVGVGEVVQRAGARGRAAAREAGDRLRDDEAAAVDVDLGARRHGRAATGRAEARVRLDPARCRR